jgi:arylsulfatase A-like enzyme
VTTKTVLIGLVLTLLCAESGWAANRPNILFILGDDVGWGDIRTNNPNGQVSLPTLERLANEGISFTDAHTTAAKCAPSRYSMITGNYQWRGRLPWGNWNYKGGSQILQGQDTLADLLKRAGYTTAFVGKYHLGAHFYKIGSNEFATGADPDSSVDFARAMIDGPGEKGFDYSFVAMRGIQAGPYAYFQNDQLDGSPSQLITWQVGDYGDTRILEDGIGLPTWNTRDVGPTLLSRAVNFIESHHQAQQSAPEPAPFFMFLNTEAVHNPRKPPVAIGDRLVRGTTGLGARTDMLVEIDAVVDSLLQKLGQLGILEDTLIIFTSDNGGLRVASEQNAGHQTTGGFRGGKGSVYEGGHRVPLIMKWGQQAFGTSPLAQGIKIDALVGTQDLYATLAELTETPVAADQARDSFSMLRILMGATTASRDHMVHEGDANSPDEGITNRNFAYRSGAWKLVFDVNQAPVGLYNLADDPFETTNLRSQAVQSNRVATMKSALENALTSSRTAPPPGEVPGPEYSLSPTSIAFGGQALNLASDAQVVILSSTGGSTLSISSIALTGTNPGQFSQGHNCPSTLPPGNTCSVSVIFRPTSSGSKSASLTVVAADGAGTKQVALSGTGVRSAMSVSPTSLSFGNQVKGTSSAAKTVMIINTGTIVLPILSITLGGTNPGQFKQTNDCPAQVLVAESCTVSVTFNPTSRGTKSANLKITAGGGAGAKSVALTGNGT